MKGDVASPPPPDVRCREGWHSTLVRMWESGTPQSRSPSSNHVSSTVPVRSVVLLSSLRVAKFPEGVSGLVPCSSLVWDLSILGSLFRELGFAVLKAGGQIGELVCVRIGWLKRGFTLLRVIWVAASWVVIRMAGGFFLCFFCLSNLCDMGCFFLFCIFIFYIAIWIFF